MHWRERAEEIKRRWCSGETLQQIGNSYGITRERVRQIVAKLGLTREDGGSCVRARALEAKRNAERDARYLAKHGMTCEAYWALPQVVRTRYKEQSNNARTRHIEWRFTLASWWGVWERSGRWGQRGRGNGYVMSRVGDVGPYSPENCRIVHAMENVQEYYDRERATYGRVRRSQERKAA